MDNRDNRDMINVPMSLERINPESSSYFFSSTKGIQLAMAIIPGVIFIPYIATLTPGSYRGLLYGILGYGVVMFLFFRFVIFEELKWKRIFRDLEKNKLSNPKYFWGIDRIDEDGIIHYKYSGGQSLKKGVVLKLIRSTVIGKDAEYEDLYKDSFRVLLNNIFRKGLEVEIYDSLDIRSVPKNILRMHRKAKKIEDDLTRDIALEHVRNLALISKKSINLEVMYMTVYFENPRQFKHINEYMREIQREIEGTTFFKVNDILNRDEVNRYIAHRLEINTLPEDEGVADVPDFRAYGEIRRLFDAEGNEEWVEGTEVTERVNFRRKIAKKTDEDDIDYDSIENEFDMSSIEMDKEDLELSKQDNEGIDLSKEVIKIENNKLDYVEEIYDLDKMMQGEDYVVQKGNILENKKGKTTEDKGKNSNFFGDGIDTKVKDSPKKRAKTKSKNEPKIKYEEIIDLDSFGGGNEVEDSEQIVEDTENEIVDDLNTPFYKEYEEKSEDKYSKKKGIFGRSVDKLRTVIKDNITDGDELTGVDEDYEYDVGESTSDLDIYLKKDGEEDDE